MKFTTLAFSAALFSYAFATIFHIFPYLYDSGVPALDGKYLSLVRYKANVGDRNNVTYTEAFGTFFYDTDKNIIWNPATEDSSGYINYFSTHNGYIVTTPNSGAKVELINSYIYISGSTPVKIKAFVRGLLPDENPSSAPSSSLAPPSSSETPSSPPSSPTPTPSGYTNTTITTTLTTTTLTYTEACTTVVTVTTCASTVTDCPARHTPIIVTTVIPLTKTTTYCPATTTPTYEPYTATYGEPITPTVAGESIVKTTAPVTEVPNGAAKAGSLAGIGMLAAAAYLL